MSGTSDLVPPGWGTDKLTEFFDLARQHAFGTFHNLKAESQRLSAIDAVFLGMIDGWQNPSNPIVAALVVRSLSALRAAMSLAMSGQLSEAYMVMRGCLEHALYASYIDSHAESGRIWMERIASRL